MQEYVSECLIDRALAERCSFRLSLLPNWATWRIFWQRDAISTIPPNHTKLSQIYRKPGGSLLAFVSLLQRFQEVSSPTHRRLAMADHSQDQFKAVRLRHRVRSARLRSRELAADHTVRTGPSSSCHSDLRTLTRLLIESAWMTRFSSPLSGTPTHSSTVQHIRSYSDLRIS